MPEHDVTTHLRRYGDWLQHRTGLELTPPPTVVLQPAVLAGPTPRRRRAVLAAAALLLATGSVWTTQHRRPTTDLEVAVASGDPPGPLYVLPSPLVPLTDASVSDNAGPVSGTEVLIVGKRTGDSYTNLATIMVGPQAAPDDAEPDPTDHAFTIRQNRGSISLTVVTAADQTDYATELLANITIDETGTARFDDTSGDTELLDTVRLDPSTTYTSTWLSIASDGTDGESIAIETATAPSPLISIGPLGGELSATRINGLDGWTISREDPEGDWHGIAWQATPNRIIAVSGHGPLDEIAALAESLIIVDEATWREANPSAASGS